MDKKPRSPNFLGTVTLTDVGERRLTEGIRVK